MIGKRRPLLDPVQIGLAIQPFKRRLNGTETGSATFRAVSVKRLAYLPGVKM